MLTTEKLNSLIITILEDAKAENIVTLDVKDLTSITDKMVICSARSSRHLKAVADQVSMKIKESTPGLTAKINGESGSGWVLVDLGDVIVHIMSEETREFYALEKLWQPQAAD